MTAAKQTLEDILTRCAGATYSNDEGAHSYVLGDEVRLPCKYLRPSHKSDCQTCHSRNWVPNPDPYAWRRAIREAGGSLSCASISGAAGDWVHVVIGNTSANVWYEEGLRDQLAEATAILRLLEGMAGCKIEETA